MFEYQVNGLKHQYSVTEMAVCVFVVPYCHTENRTYEKENPHLESISCSTNVGCASGLLWAISIFKLMNIVLLYNN